MRLSTLALVTLLSLCIGYGREGFSEYLTPGSPFNNPICSLKNPQPDPFTYRPGLLKTVSEKSWNRSPSVYRQNNSCDNLSNFNSRFYYFIKAKHEEFSYLFGRKNSDDVGGVRKENRIQKFHLAQSLTRSDGEIPFVTDSGINLPNQWEYTRRKRIKSIDLYASESVKWDLAVDSANDALTLGVGLGEVLYIDAMAGADARVQAGIKIDF